MSWWQQFLMSQMNVGLSMLHATFAQYLTPAEILSVKRAIKVARELPARIKAAKGGK